MGRNATIHIKNETGYKMSYVGSKIEHGKFQKDASPPATINAGATGTFEVGNTTGLKTGPKGTVTYKVEIQGIELQLVFFWDHPFSASTSTYRAYSIPAGYCSYYLNPSNPTGHDQNLTIVTSLANINSLFDIKKWMNYIDPTSQLSQLSIPGTHDTCALHGGAIVECQTMNVKTQLEKGIRYLDIRCKLKDDELKIYHGIIYQEINFGQVRDTCIQFLKDNPSETIIMSVKNEDGDSSDEKKVKAFQDKFNSYVQDTAASWYTETAIPTLNTAKKKIVLFRRFAVTKDTAKLGINALPWKDNASFSTDNGKIEVQDEYKVYAGIGMEDKWKAIKKTLEASAADTDNKLYINFSSGSTLMNPIDVAEGLAGSPGMNSRLYNYLPLHPGKKTGVIVMDFPEYPFGELITMIVKQNKFK